MRLVLWQLTYRAPDYITTVFYNCVSKSSKKLADWKTKHVSLLDTINKWLVNSTQHTWWNIFCPLEKDIFVSADAFAMWLRFLIQKINDVRLYFFILFRVSNFFTLERFKFPH